MTGLEHEADAIIGTDRPKVLLDITQFYVHGLSNLATAQQLWQQLGKESCRLLAALLLQSRVLYPIRWRR